MVGGVPKRAFGRERRLLDPAPTGNLAALPGRARQWGGLRAAAAMGAVAAGHGEYGPAGAGMCTVGISIHFTPSHPPTQPMGHTHVGRRRDGVPGAVWCLVLQPPGAASHDRGRPPHGPLVHPLPLWPPREPRRWRRRRKCRRRQPATIRAQEPAAVAGVGGPRVHQPSTGKGPARPEVHSDPQQM